MRISISFLFAILSLSQAFSCSVSEDECLSSLFSIPSIRESFLGGKNTVIFQNDLTKDDTNGMGSACPKMTVLFARGTSEPGNVGILTGPPMFAALAAYMNSTNQIAIQGIDYPADIAGFLSGGSPAGAAVMAAFVNNSLTTCPTTPLVISGYSQGAQVVHLTMASLPTNTTSKIASIVLFGDPKNGTALPNVEGNKVLTFCHSGDDICKGGDDVGIAHLNYSSNAAEAAMFVLGSAGGDLGITSQRLKPADGGLG